MITLDHGKNRRDETGPVGVYTDVIRRIEEHKQMFTVIKIDSAKKGRTSNNKGITVVTTKVNDKKVLRMKVSAEVYDQLEKAKVQTLGLAQDDKKVLLVGYKNDNGNWKLSNSVKTNGITVPDSVGLKSGDNFPVSDWSNNKEYAQVKNDFNIVFIGGITVLK